MLSRGDIDIDERTPEGATALMIAAILGYPRIVGALLNNGANVALVSGKRISALHRSAQSGHVAVTKLLVKAGADLETKSSETGSTPLHLATGGGHSEVARVLIEAGANPNSRSLNGSTPLYNAAHN